MTTGAILADFVHRRLDCGVELAVDRLPERESVCVIIRMLTGLREEPPEMAGIASIVEDVLSKGTENYTGRELADAFDRLGAMHSTMSGRESMVFRAVCLPEFLPPVVDLAAEMFRRPTFPDDACGVAVELARQDLRSVEDDPGEVCRMMIQRLTLGPILGRDPTGELETLNRITPAAVREHWRKTYRSGRMQVAAAGPIDADALADRLDERFVGWDGGGTDGREHLALQFAPGRVHRDKQLKQQQIAITLPGVPRGDDLFAVEKVLLGVLSGGMSGRLFTEVREKQGLVYSVSAWHEQPRGTGVIHMRASSTPENCLKTFTTMMREVERVSEDLTEDEIERARNSLAAHALTHDDVTRGRASSLSEDLYYFGRPVGLAPKIDAVQGVTRAQVIEYARRFDTEHTCVATLGPKDMAAPAAN